MVMMKTCLLSKLVTLEVCKKELDVFEGEMKVCVLPIWKRRHRSQRKLFGIVERQIDRVKTSLEG